MTLQRTYLSCWSRSSGRMFENGQCFVESVWYLTVGSVTWACSLRGVSGLGLSHCCCCCRSIYSGDTLPALLYMCQFISKLTPWILLDSSGHLRMPQWEENKFFPFCSWCSCVNREYNGGKKSQERDKPWMLMYWFERLYLNVEHV